MFGWLFGQHSFSNFKIVIAAFKLLQMIKLRLTDSEILMKKKNSQ